ncbi:MAG: antitoxin Xre-like helix-turn-helix domain-containing protein [Rhodospirillales bacterium]
MAKGFPVRTVEILAAQIAPHDRSFKYRIVSKATYSRRSPSKPLSKAESERVARLVQVWQAALDVWGTPEETLAFLERPHALLGGEPPMALTLESDVGARRATLATHPPLG